MTTKIPDDIMAKAREGEDDPLHLTEYEIQVLLGCSISGCRMSPDRVFSLHMAWHRLFATGLIDRSDGLAIITTKGRAVIDRILALLSERTASEAALKEARAKLFPYADATEISGMSWNGFYLIGDDKSIKELRRLENRSSQIEIFKAAFDEKVATLEAENARLLAEVERLTKALAESDRQSEKLEALLDPHVSWDDADLTPTKENADAG